MAGKHNYIVLVLSQKGQMDVIQRFKDLFISMKKLKKIDLPLVLIYLVLDTGAKRIKHF